MKPYIAKISAEKVEHKLKQGDRLGNYKLGEILGAGSTSWVVNGTALNGEMPSKNIEVAIKTPYHLISEHYYQGDYSSMHYPRSEFPTVSTYKTGILYFHTGSVEYSTSFNNSKIGKILCSEFIFLCKLSAISYGIFPEPILINIDGDSLLETFSNRKENPDCHTWFAMEKLNGINFRTIISETSIYENLKYIKSILLVCDYLYELNSFFFHGDIKPENIIINNDKVHMIDPVPRFENTLKKAYNPLKLLTIQYNPYALSGVCSDTLAVTIMIIEVLLKSHPFRDFSSTDLYSPNMLTTLKEDQINEYEIMHLRSNRLGIDAFRNQLPDTVKDILIQWVLSPPKSYKEMLDKWDSFRQFS